MDQSFAVLRGRLKVDGSIRRPNLDPDLEWCKFKGFCHALRLPTNQLKRDYIKGKRAWRIDNGTVHGRLLRKGPEWDNKAAEHGGGRKQKPPLHATTGVLKKVYAKYYPHRALRQ